jgi:hypothetical protein
MINGAHIIIYSKDSKADIAFFRSVLNLANVDVGYGWLIFSLPPAELAVHPYEENNKHELYLMCDDLEAFIDTMVNKGIACSPIQNQGWGILTELALPGGGSLGVYQPKHKRPSSV